MGTDLISIDYPSVNLGSKKSNITFIDGPVDLVKLFLDKKENPIQKRFFITDSNVASLECLQNFTSKFDDGVYENDFLMVIGSGEKSKSVEIKKLQTLLSLTSYSTEEYTSPHKKASAFSALTKPLSKILYNCNSLL